MATTDRVALVTGAGRGIGRATALALGGEGFRVALLARTAPELEEVARELDLAGNEALVLPADLQDAEAAALAVKRTAERFGRLDVLVNNAGVTEERPFSELQYEEIDRVLSTTLRGTIVTTRAALPWLLRAGEGAAVVNIASLAGRRPLAGAGIHSAAKHGVVGFSESLFEEVRDSGLKVCAILPGSVDTNPALDERARSRMLSPEDIASTVLWVLQTSPRMCPTEIVLRPQRKPR